MVGSLPSMRGQRSSCGDVPASLKGTSAVEFEGVALQADAKGYRGNEPGQRASRGSARRCRDGERFASRAARVRLMSD